MTYRTLQRLVPVLLALHNLEEAVTFPAYRPRVRQLLAEHTTLPPDLVPSVATFRAALVVATVAPALLVAVATTGRPRPAKLYLVALVQAAVLWNVILPHVPAAIALGGYAPGTATALAINLPFSLYFFHRSVREHRLTPRGLALVLASGVPILFATIAALLLG